MKKRILYWILMAALTLLLAGPQAMAKGKGQKGNAGTPTPAGWEKGQKKGWKGDAPPRHGKEATEAIGEKTQEKTMKAKESKERTQEEGEDAEKLMEKERENAKESGKE